MEGDPARRDEPAGRSPLRVGLVGYGTAGRVFHAPLIAAAPGLELASIVTANPERAERAAAEHPGARVLSEPDALWAAAGDHDVAVIAAPNRAHVELALTAIDAGLHVVVDKPLAASADDGRRVAEAADERGLVAAAFHNRRWDGDALTVRSLLDRGAVGRPFRFESRFERWRPAIRADAWRERADPAEAGGVLFDLGSHLIDQALWLFGPVRRVFAEVESRRPGAEVDDDSFVALAHEGGVHSHLWMSQVAAQPGPRMRLVGSDAGYVKWGLDVQEGQLGAGLKPGEPGFGREPHERWGTLGTEDDTVRVETEPGDYAAFYDGFERAVRSGEAPPVSAGEAVETLILIEAALESARSGAAIEL
jgi:scyllo-inositol 2-dehydrogenase (NADP+)